MKRILITLISLGSIFSVSACSSNETALSKLKQLRSPEGLSHSYNYNETRSEEYLLFKSKFKSLSTRLSESFAKREFEENKNLALSPLSIEMCLGLAIRSGSGKTREELLNIFGIDYENFNKYYSLFYNELSFEKKNSFQQLLAQLFMTNSIWIDNDVALLDSGLDALRDDYYCYSYEVDFDKNNKNTNDAISEFISEKTKGLIKPNLNLPNEVSFVLMNTLYLKDIWNEEGNDLTYAPATYKFKNLDGSYSSKNLLSGQYVLGRTLENDSYSAFKTFTESGFGLYFIKPNQDVDILDVFNSENIEYVVDENNYIVLDNGKFERYHTNCIFPEFIGECDTDLKKMFKEDFNVQTLFDTSCDFSNLARDSVYCEEFKQIAKLEVNKKGIEGAAVTYMAMCGASGPDERYTDVYETFVVDKEFGYVLTYNDAILFSGITTNIDA